MERNQNEFNSTHPENPFKNLSDGEIENALQKFSEKKEASQGTRERSKTSLRLKYEAEVEVIQKKIGNIEQIRHDLGLSRRKMCQLLMVDPSSWTRWTQNPESIPPHIYRGLQWYLALIEKHPEWHPQNTYFGSSTFSQGRVLVLEKQMEEMKKHLQKKNSWLLYGKVLLIFNTVFLVFLFLYLSLF